jgi:hypothetical protein
VALVSSITASSPSDIELHHEEGSVDRCAMKLTRTARFPSHLSCTVQAAFAEQPQQPGRFLKTTIDALDEGDDDFAANNVSSSPVGIGAPDLMVESLSIAGQSLESAVPLNAGTTALLTATVRNIGAFKSSDLRFILTMSSLDASSAPMTFMSDSTAIDSDQVSHVDVSLPLPPSLTPGDYVLRLRVNQADSGPECSIINNDRVIAIRVLAALP